MVRCSAVAISCGSRCERTTIQVLLETCCRKEKNIAGLGSSVRVWYLPSSTTPTTSARWPPQNLKCPPIALSTDPNTLRANSRLITATTGVLFSSCMVRLRPARSAVPAARK